MCCQSTIFTKLNKHSDRGNILSLPTTGSLPQMLWLNPLCLIISH